MQHGSVFGSKNHRKTKNTDSKRHHKIDQLLDRLFIDFCCVLEANLDPMLATFLGPRRPKRPPRRSQDASKTIPRAPQDPIQPGLATKTGVPHQPRGGTPSAQVVFWSIFGRFWLIFDRCLVDFLINVLLIFGRFLVDLLIIFCRFLIDV